MTAKKYINRIVRKIKCSKKERREIRNQLHSDIVIAMEHGETLTEVMCRMGSASEVAAEFNANISEEEQKKYKRLVTVKIVVVTVAVVLCLLAGLAWWWMPKSYEFGTSGKYDASVVEARAMKQVTTRENMELARKIISDDWGDFESFGSVFMVEVEQQGLKGVMVQVSALYEKVGVNYVISFDEDMQLIGFYMR